MYYGGRDIYMSGRVRSSVRAVRKIVEPPDEDASLYPPGTCFIRCLLEASDENPSAVATRIELFFHDPLTKDAYAVC